MKVAIITSDKIGGGYTRAKAYDVFLRKHGYNTRVYNIPSNNNKLKIWFYTNNIISKIKKQDINFVHKLASKLEKIIRAESFDAIIGVQTRMAYVLTKDINCVKIFSCESLEADERYFSKSGEDLDNIRKWRNLELEIFDSSDYVVFPWKTTENYVKQYISNQKNFLTLKYGCYPQEKRASFFFPVSIVSLGNLKPYWANKELMSYLTSNCPYTIDIYGKFKPNKKYGLNYKGYADSLDVLCNYQFGLNCISEDIFRINHHSSRVMSYLSYGLPVLSPTWMKFTNELKGTLSYDEENFTEILNEYSNKDQWASLSEDAFRQACELDWNITLKPLLNLLNK